MVRTIYYQKNMDYEVEYFFDSWARKYFKFITCLGMVGVFVASFFVEPGEAALYLMTMNEFSKI